MRIGISTMSLNPVLLGGVRVYMKNLIKSLEKVDRENEYFVFIKNGEKEFDFIKAKNFKKVVLYDQRTSFLNRYINYFSAREKIKRCRLDVIHCLNNGIDLPVCDVPTVITVHDLQHEYYPEFFTKEELEKRRKSYQHSAERASRIIAISEYVKSTIIDKFKVDANKIDIVYHACFIGRDSVEKSELRNNMSKYNISGKLIYYPSATHFHKNHLRLLEAFNLMRKKYKTANNYMLLFTGAPKNAEAEIEKTIEKFNLKNFVYKLGYIPFEEIPYFYINSAIVVFPSLYEGFGMPLVEAMTFGCPVACSNTTSLPEIANDAAVFFDPYNVEDICDKMYAVLTDKALREELISKGKKRAEYFSWEKTAVETIKTYRKVYEAERRRKR
jgi:glycosyltransferase involved in cell wall biosynthesis